MSSLSSTSRTTMARTRAGKQRGVALFFALICLVAIMLAAVVLVRSVDTATLISGNLAFQQSATVSGDGGTEAAVTWLTATEAANGALNVLNNAAHPFNNDDPANGYYASLDPARSLTATTGTRFIWNTTVGDVNKDSVGIAADTSGNTVSYIIQRNCRTSGVAVQATNCLYSGAALNSSQQNVPLPQEICNGPGCPVAGQTPTLRITSRITGPKNTISYVQAFVY